MGRPQEEDDEEDAEEKNGITGGSLIKVVVVVVVGLTDWMSWMLGRRLSGGVELVCLLKYF